MKVERLCRCIFGVLVLNIFVMVCFSRGNLMKIIIERNGFGVSVF